MSLPFLLLASLQCLYRQMFCFCSPIASSILCNPLFFFGVVLLRFFFRQLRRVEVFFNSISLLLPQSSFLAASLPLTFPSSSFFFPCTLFSLSSNSYFLSCPSLSFHCPFIFFPFSPPSSFFSHRKKRKEKQGRARVEGTRRNDRKESGDKE